MNRRALLTGVAAVGGVAALGAAGLGMWARQGLAAWREAGQAIRRPLASGARGQEALRELVRAATLSANSHNTQAWRFAVGEAAIAILPDFTRRTPIVDPDDHHLFVSMGATAENIVQAAPVFGLLATPRFEPGGDGSVIVDLRAGEVASTALADAITKRQCSRSLYDGRVVPDENLKTLVMAGGGDGVEIRLVTEPSAIESLTSLIIDGNSAQMRDAAFVAELKHWLRFNYADALSTGDGLFSAVSGNPALPGPIGNALFDMTVSEDSENTKYRAQIASSAGLAIFVSERNDKEHWVAAGRAYQRFALHATVLGVKHAFVNQAVEVEAVRRRLADHLGLGEGRPDMIVRFGYGPEMPWSMRRPVSAVIA